MSTWIPAAALVGKQQHDPPGAALHLALVAGVVVAALVVFGVSRWRRRRDTENKHAKEDE
jgi:membrane protein implicated in regulation of membrane protease activity